MKKQNTVKQIISLISTDRQKARQLGIRMLNTEYRDEVIAAFKATEEPVYCDCGAEIERKFTEQYLLYRSPGNMCTGCGIKKEDEYQEEIRTRNEETRNKAFINFIDNKNTIINNILSDCGLPKIYLQSDMSKINSQIKDVIGTSNKNLYIFGGIGTGKTYLAAAIMRSHLENIEPEYNGCAYRIDENLYPKFVCVPELLLEIRRTFSDNANDESTVIDKYTNANLLVLDDLGVEKTTDWALQTLYIIINRRYSEPDKITIVTSNLTLDSVSRLLNERISSRLKGMCKIIELKGKDRRIGK